MNRLPEEFFFALSSAPRGITEVDLTLEIRTNAMKRSRRRNGSGVDGKVIVEGMSERTGKLVSEELAKMARASSLSPDDAEEVVSEAKLWVLEKRDPERPVTRRWLSVVFRRFVSSFVRKKARHPVTSLEELEELPNRRAQSDDLDLLLHEIEAGMPDDEKHVLELRLAGYSWLEALDSVHVPPGSRSRWVRRFRESLTRLLKVG